MTGCRYSASSDPMAVHGRALIEPLCTPSIITGASRRDIPIGGDARAGEVLR
jgi:hypothetical protein